MCAVGYLCLLFGYYALITYIYIFSIWQIVLYVYIHQVDITYFPFDWQTCHLKFGSWSYDKAQLDLINKTSIVDVTNYITNGEWTLYEYHIERHEVRYLTFIES